MTARPVSIVILTWNGLAFTRRCLETLRENTHHPDYEIVVADNGSTDGTLEYLRALDGVRVIENGSNLGFVRGNNRALEAIAADRDVVLLNNDIEIHQPDWLERLQATAEQSESVGLVGCRLRRPDGTLQHAGTYMPPELWWGQQYGAGDLDVNQYPSDRVVEGVVFACVYIKRAVLDRIGFLDEDYFSYFEDTDYCLKAAEQGFQTVCCGSVTLEHHERVSTKLNKVPHSRMFHESQAIFRRKWEAKLTANRYDQSLGWHSIINFPSGYAISSRQLALALERQRVRVCYKYLYGPETVFAVPEPEHNDHPLINIIRERRIDPSDIQVAYGQADMFHANFGRYKIGYTMLEPDGIPAEWVQKCNLMDEVWVPSSHNVRTFRDSGVTRPIHIIPLGVDPEAFHPEVTAWKNPHAFTFLSVFEWGERKAPDILLRAFTDEFRATEDVILLCKVFNFDGAIDVREEIAKLGLRPGGGRIVVSLNEEVQAHQLPSLYRSADAFVLSSRGEGWGMPILEAMACGIPTIATAWSAQTDFFHEGVGFPVEIDGLIPAQAKCPYYEGFRWAEPSYEHLRAQMRYVFEHPSEAADRGAMAAHEARTRWTWDRAAEKILERLAAVGRVSRAA